MPITHISPAHRSPARRPRPAGRALLVLLSAGLFGGCEGSTTLEPQASTDALALGARSSGSDGRDSSRTDPESCRGTLGAVTVEQVNVPSGATCVLDGTRVRGNVFVRRGATLEAYGARIDGNIQAEDAQEVRTAAGTFVDGNIQVKRRAFTLIEDTTVEGDVQVEEWGATLEAWRNVIGGNLQFKKADAATVLETRIDGDLQLEENAGRLTATANRVRGNLQVSKNRGGVSLVDNRVSQALQCKENSPAPVGGGNVAGEKEGQCRGL